MLLVHQHGSSLAGGEPGEMAFRCQRWLAGFPRKQGQGNCLAVLLPLRQEAGSCLLPLLADPNISKICEVQELTSVPPTSVPEGRKVITPLLFHSPGITEACAGQPGCTYIPVTQRCHQPKQRKMQEEMVQGGRRGSWKGSERPLGGVRDDRYRV